MEVLALISSDKRTEVRVSTNADTHRLWSRFRSRVATPGEALSYCDYASSFVSELLLANPTSGELTSEGTATSWEERHPVCYETATYNFNIRLRGLEGRPAITHQTKQVCDMFTAIPLNGDSDTATDWILTGTLDFTNEPGIFKLSWRYTPAGDKEHSDSLSLRVVSPKLDTKNDYLHVLEVIDKTYHEIVFRQLSATQQGLMADGRSDNDLVWLSIFRKIADDYLKAVRYIADRPHLTDLQTVTHSRADRIKKWTRTMAMEYLRTPGQDRERAYFRHETTVSANDTRENRFVKYSLGQISRRLGHIYDDMSQRNLLPKTEYKTSHEELEKLGSCLRRVRKLSQTPMLRKLKGEPMRSESIVLQKRTGYAQVYKSWITLKRGISMYEGKDLISVRPICELYELWCFLKMRQMVADILGLEFSKDGDIEEDPASVTNPFAGNGHEHTVIYHGADEVRLHYQHTYNRHSGTVHTATTDNRPDITLVIRKPDGFELTYLFDAKYRVDDDRQHDTDCNRFADSPPPDALNQMHRYRDAICHRDRPADDVPGRLSKEVIGGYILFPGRGDDTAVRERYYFKSIEQVNIGAFPLLPDHLHPENEGTLLKEFLHKILTATSAHDQLENSIPQKGLRYVPVTSATQGKPTR